MGNQRGVLTELYYHIDILSQKRASWFLEHGHKLLEHYPEQVNICAFLAGEYSQNRRLPSAAKAKVF